MLEMTVGLHWQNANGLGCSVLMDDVPSALKEFEMRVAIGTPWVQVEAAVFDRSWSEAECYARIRFATLAEHGTKQELFAALVRAAQ
jgi:hypothetical protein